MEVVEIGRAGKPHGLAGELKLRVEDAYEDDLLTAGLVLIGQPPLPYFLESARGGGALIVKLETLDSREAVAPLAGRTLFLPADRVTATAPAANATPFDAYLGYRIAAEGYPELGPIDEIVGLPEHYLAQIEHDEKTVLIPLHEDLIVTVSTEKQTLMMRLPEGLLEL